MELESPRPELTIKTSQTILLLNTIDSSPYPRKLYLLYDPDLNEKHYKNQWFFSEIALKKK